LATRLLVMRFGLRSPLMSATAPPDEQDQKPAVRVSSRGPVIGMSENPHTSRTPDFLKKEACRHAIAFPAGCAAPPPVEIASYLIGRSLPKKATDEVQTSGTAQSTAPQQ
jgi:hypothetical protein